MVNPSIILAEHRGHVLDFAVSVVGLLIGTFALEAIEPTHRPFRVDDVDISYEMGEETISTVLLVIISLPLPMLLMLAIHYGHNRQARTKAQLIYRLLGIFYATTLTTIITNIIKISYGKLRPDFLDRCQPDENSVCTGDEDEIREGRKSFPSGHASYSFAGCVYLTLVLLSELRPLSKENMDRSPFCRLGLSIWPLVGAALVCVSRVVDYRHHPADVFGGGLLGFIISVSCYYLHHGVGPIYTQLEAEERFQRLA
eukprot:TRINITY_DN2873_c0_g4_i1.p1 TRINITY_DN2873_c0_g4~~TRINITY_DN2873_c0_g4_i1.p1  ORF type:complete len:256 (-),score=52.90 TRINITY_DN2873_c0_g4_i1:128-895(-)